VAREIVLSQLADAIVSLQRSHPLRVAIDGIDAAGKTTLADQLMPVIEQRGRSVIRASIDGFHHRRSKRYQRRPDSPQGYYEDSFDYASLLSALLHPLGPNGSRHYRNATFDVYSDVPLVTKEEEASPNAILLFDGVFLLRPELNSLWDYRIFVHVDFEVALQRAKVRDEALFGSLEVVQARYLQRYLPGQRLYFQAVDPQKRADVVFVNNDPVHPLLVFPD
jgi:uridine kinase